MKQPRSRRLSLWAVGYIKVAQRETGPQEKKRAAKTRLISGKRKKSEAKKKHLLLPEASLSNHPGASQDWSRHNRLHKYKTFVFSLKEEGMRV